jgi:DNA-binding MarR family transcriptional regulator
MARDRDTLFDEISEALPEVTRLLRADRPVRRGERRMTVAQLRVLRAVPDHGNCTTDELAQRLGVSGRTLARLADRLVQRGLIVRRAGLSEPGSVYLQLGPAGKEARHAIHMQSRRRLQAATRDLSLPQLEQMADSILLLRRALSETEPRHGAEHL